MYNDIGSHLCSLIFFLTRLCILTHLAVKNHLLILQIVKFTTDIILTNFQKWSAVTWFVWSPCLYHSYSVIWNDNIHSMDFLVSKMTASWICLMPVKWFEDENRYISAKYCYWSLKITRHNTSDSLHYWHESNFF